MRITEALIGRAAATVDRAASLAIGRMQTNAAVRALGHEQRLERLAAIEAFYANRELFPSPRPAEPALRSVRLLADGGEVIDASWGSGYEPAHPEVVDRWREHRANGMAHARLYVGPGSRPAAVLVHGYGTGQWALEERLWPLQDLRDAGWDAAIFVLPFHALRATTAGPPAFPGPDPCANIEGFAQAIHDLRALVAWLRARGAASVAAIGMSVGGYTTSLLATVEPLDFCAGVLPLASIGLFAHEHGHLGTGARALEQAAALDSAYRVASPLGRRSVVPPERVCFVGAVSDRICPLHHAERLAEHFGAPLHRCGGGHLVQYGLGRGYREILRRMSTAP